MPDEVFNFRWSVDMAGYDLVDVQPKFAGIFPSITDATTARVFLVGRGGDLRWYNPLEDEPGLFRRFAATCIIPIDVRRFADQFGHLWNEERVNDAWDALDVAASIRAVTKIIDSGDWREAAAIFNERIKITFRPRILIPERAGRPTLQFTMGTLVEALWFQLARQLTGQTEFRVCKNCPTPFEVGAGAHTKRKKFCSDRCRVAWHRSE